MDVWERVPSACNYQLKSAPLIEEIAKVLHYTAISCQDVEKSGNKVNVF